jgi:hypothetical protein
MLFCYSTFMPGEVIDQDLNVEVSRYINACLVCEWRVLLLLPPGGGGGGGGGGLGCKT